MVFGWTDAHRTSGPTEQQRTNIPSPLNSGAVVGFWSSAASAPSALSLSFIVLNSPAMFGALVFDLASLPARLFTVLARVIDTVVETLHWQWVRLTHRPTRILLPDTRRRRHVFATWRERVLEPYDPEAHRPLLRRLWVASSFPEEEFSPTSRRWTSIGFQSPEPATDFRGGGALSLKCMVYMAETYHEEYMRLSAERPLEVYYPFCASFINVSFALLDVLGIRDLGVGDELGRSPTNKCTYGFVRRIVVYDDDAYTGDDGIGYGGAHRHHHHPVELAFFEVAVETMIELDRVFKAEGASYMDFPRVRAMVLEGLVRRIGHRRSYARVSGT